MNRHFLVFIIIILGSIVGICNPPVRFSHYSTSNGLPNDFVLSFAQDNNRFIWLGTHLGIVRFDGHNFKLFQPNPQNKNSLSYKHVSGMYCDLHDNIWISFTEDALNRMDIQTEKFYNYHSDTSNINSISGVDINRFFEDSDSVLWIASKKGLDIYNNITGEFYAVIRNSVPNISRLNNNIQAVTDDTLGNVWFQSEKEIGRINRNNHEVVSLTELLKDQKIGNLNINSLVSDRKSNLWFSTKYMGVFKYDIVSNKLENILKDDSGIQSIYCDSQGNFYVYSNDKGNVLYFFDRKSIDKNSYSKHYLFDVTDPVAFFTFTEDKLGNIWMSSSQGLDEFTKEKQVIHYKYNVYQENSLSSNLINKNFVDHNNNLWISSYRKGIDKADLHQKPFNWYFTSPAQSNNVFISTNITSIMEDSDNYLWIGATGNSIIRFNRNTNTTTPILIKNSRNTMFSAMFEDSKGDIWIGNYGGGVYRVNKKSLNITYSADKVKVGEINQAISGVRKFVEDKENNLWFVSRSGVYKWIRKTEQIIPYSLLFDKEVRSHGFYRTLFIDKTGTLWSGSYNGGLAQYDIRQNKIKRYQHIPGDKTSISGNGVYEIFEESDTTFLIGTTMGLNRFNKITETFSLVETKKSINHYSIYTIIPDSINNYWMASDNGLICLNKSTLECTFYNEGDGLLANEFNTTASFTSRNGDIFLGCPKGLISFNPNDFLDNPYKAKPAITNLQISNVTISPGDTLNGRILLTKQIWVTDELVLKYFENDFTLQFSAMHFAVPENNKFWYKLEGYKDEWIPTDAHRRWASYTGLPPGEYNFKLKATNNDGVICNTEDIVSLKITITPPFWMTIWFKLLLILIIACLAAIIVRLRFLRLKRHNNLLDYKVKLRTKELHEANISLEDKQEEISTQKEELIIQKESLELINKALRANQDEIISQKNELDVHRNKLEDLVESRTVELEKALAKAKESDRLKSSFLANMSHEIRTPMNAILGFSSLLKDEDIPEADKQMFYNTIISSSESLMVLVNDILDISKIQSDQLSIFLQDLNIHDILQELFEIFNVETINNKVQLSLNVSKIENDYVIVTDGVRFKQAISNLLSNAIKFTHQGIIEFGVYEVSEQITFYVKDTGIGIPSKIGDSIFERFLKVEENIDNIYRGSGLGLAITKSIVNLLGGKIWYESKQNFGTTFYFTHALNKEKTIVHNEEPLDFLSSINLKGLSLLIVEDEKSNFDLLTAYLEKTGANIIWAQDGKEACETVEKNKIDLILMDIKMPIMGGIEASERIKLIHPNIPIIAQTAYANIKQTETALNKTIDYYITKPIKLVELFTAIKKFI